MEDLTFEEVRIIGTLIEKELTTPEYYPLTVNSLIVKLPRQTGMKESRYAHLLSGMPDTEKSNDQKDSAATNEQNKIEELQKEHELLKTKLEDLKNQFEKFKKQFE